METSMPSRDPELVLPLTPVVFHTLIALAGGRAHGYAIAQVVERETSGRIRMGPGTLYGSLQRMRDESLIEEVANPGDEGVHSERRRYYRLTRWGSAVLRAETGRLRRAVELAAGRIGG
jgi:DNA-binding PadR family transcriptional regulator